MYGKSTADDVMYGTRKDSYLAQLGLNTGDHVFVWQDYQSTNNKRSVVRMFDTAGTIPYWAERNGKNYYTGNGSSARNWENTSILSETLCHRKKTDANCADLVTRFETKSYTPISQSTCNSNKSALSITNCPVATDYWAGAVKTCGGVDMIASEDDLFELAKCMYGKTQASSSMYGTRNNTYLSSLGLSTNSHEYVWSAYQNNKGDHNAIVRMFASDGSIPYWAERDGSKYYEGNGSYPTNWKSSGIKSKVLCRKGTSPSSTCSSDYTITSRPSQGNCSSCGDKYKCEGGATLTKFGNTGVSVCYNSSHPCDFLNYSSCQNYASGREKYVDSASECPYDMNAVQTSPLFHDSVFIGTSFYDMRCYHCEEKSSGSSCNSSSYTATITCRLVNTVQSHTGCPGQTGVGLFACDFNVPSCAFSQAGVYDSSGNALYSYGAGTGSVTVPSCKLNGTCKFFVSGNTLKGTAQLSSNGSGEYSCSYTKGPGQN